MSFKNIVLFLITAAIIWLLIDIYWVFKALADFETMLRYAPLNAIFAILGPVSSVGALLFAISLLNNKNASLLSDDEDAIV